MDSKFEAKNFKTFLLFVSFLSMKNGSNRVKKNVWFGLTLILFAVIFIAACSIAPLVVFFENLTKTTVPIVQNSSIGSFCSFLSIMTVKSCNFKFRIKVIVS
jgi:hypothetical protein